MKGEVEMKKISNIRIARLLAPAMIALLIIASAGCVAGVAPSGGTSAAQTGAAQSGVAEGVQADSAADASPNDGENSKDPFAKYGDVVTLTAGMPISPNVAKLPDGDTAENNGYSRHFFELSNIQIVNAF